MTVLDINTLPLALEELGLQNQNWGCSASSYGQLQENWKGTVPLPSEQELVDAYSRVELVLEEQGVKDDLAATDREMARSVEDLTQFLISEGVIDGNRLPTIMKDKINARAGLRSQLSAVAARRGT